MCHSQFSRTRSSVPELCRVNKENYIYLLPAVECVMWTLECVHMQEDLSKAMSSHEDTKKREIAVLEALDAECEVVKSTLAQLSNLKTMLAEATAQEYMRGAEMEAHAHERAKFTTELSQAQVSCACLHSRFFTLFPFVVPRDHQYNHLC